MFETPQQHSKPVEVVNESNQKYLLVALKVNPDSPLKQSVVACVVNCDVKMISC